MKTALVTGANGFVGNFLCSRLISEGWVVRGCTRFPSYSTLAAGVEPVVIEPLGPETRWTHALKDIDVVIHLAARVHIMDDKSADPLKEFRLVNTFGTERLAKEAVSAGVKRFVFVSTIKVNGEETSVPYRETDMASTTDPYGVSKLDAEVVLRRIEQEHGLEIVVVRPTLVYGPGVKANFLKMMRMIYIGIPMPLASIVNSRSLIYVDNLADALAVCASHPSAAGQTYLVSDGEDVSTPELIRRVAAALGRPERLIPFPLALMRFVGRLTNRTAHIDRLLGSLNVDSSKIRRELSWHPPYTMEYGLKNTAMWFVKQFGGKVSTNRCQRITL